MENKNVFLQRFTSLLVRQAQQLESGKFPVAPEGSSFKSVAEILGSDEYLKHFGWSKDATATEPK